MKLSGKPCANEKSSYETYFINCFNFLLPQLDNYLTKQ